MGQCSTCKIYWSISSAGRITRLWRTCFTYPSLYDGEASERPHTQQKSQTGLLTWPTATDLVLPEGSKRARIPKRSWADADRDEPGAASEGVSYAAAPQVQSQKNCRAAPLLAPAAKPRERRCRR